MPTNVATMPGIWHSTSKPISICLHYSSTLCLDDWTLSFHYWHKSYISVGECHYYIIPWAKMIGEDLWLMNMKTYYITRNWRFVFSSTFRTIILFFLHCGFAYVLYRFFSFRGIVCICINHKMFLFRFCYEFANFAKTYWCPVSS